MATGRLFAYNSGHTVVDGAEIKGDLSIQTGIVDPTALPWWMGPNETIYPWIIAGPHSSSPSTPQFWAPAENTESSFLDLMKRNFYQIFPTAYSGATWLDQNGYWLSFTITTTTTVAPTTTTTTTAASYTIGDSALGGKIAYILVNGDPGYDAGVQHGLVATSGDTSTSCQWGCAGTLLGATGFTIGTGQANTTRIVNNCADVGIAAKLASDLVEGGYSDWYLPSKNELNKLYLNKTLIGGFSPSYYWSSSEATAHYVWYQNFSNGGQNYYGKSNYFRVRSVRGF
jgi:hypothetical protein